MTAKAKGVNGGDRAVIGILIGSLCALALSLMLTAIIAGLISTGRIRQEGMNAAAYVLMFACTLIGTFCAGKITGSKPVIICVATAAVFALCLIGCSVFFFNSALCSLWNKLGTILLAGIISSIIIARMGRGKKRRSR